MRLRGRRLTMVLTIVLIVVVGGGASAAWALGKTRPGSMPDGYAAGPSGWFSTFPHGNVSGRP